MSIEGLPLVVAAAAKRGKLKPVVAIEALLTFAHRSDQGLVSILRRGTLRPEALPRLHQSTSALLRHSGFAELPLGKTFLESRSQDWATFSEPQITGGWAHFLKSRHRLAGCQAFIDAAFKGHSNGANIAPCTSVELIEAELGRIDLLVIARTALGQRVAVCIEAKLGHVITAGQLSMYQCRLDDPDRHNVADPKLRSLLIVAPRHRRDIAAQLGVPGNEWRFLSWTRWLIRFENALPTAADDEDFRRFRRTTFVRSNREIETT